MTVLQQLTTTAREGAKAGLSGLRLVGRSPALAVTAITTLAVGIGATTALLTVVNRVVLEPLPFPAAQQIVQVWRSELPALTYGSASYARYLDWRAAQEPFSEFGAWAPRAVTVTGTGEPERLGAAIASSSFFRLLGLAPTLGRWIDDQDDRPGATRVAVISDGLWRRRFGASPGVVGATAHFDGEPHTIVGVAPAAVSEVWRPEVWLPLAQHADAANRGNNFLLSFGRLRAGTTLAAARQSLDRLADQMHRAHPEDAYTFTARDLHDVVTEGVSQRLWVVLGATVLLLVIACTNVANLLLARAVALERDLAVRASLGARRGDLLAYVVGEATALALLGSLGGAALAWALLRAFVASAPAGFPRLAAITIDVWLLAVGVVTALAAALVSSVVPVIHLLRTDFNASVRGAGDRFATARRARTAGRVLVVAEMALALTLLTAAGLLAKSVARLQAQDLGMTAEPLLTFAVAAPATAVPDDTATVRFHDEFLASVRALPGVGPVSAINMLPIAATGFNGIVRRADQTGERDGVPVTEVRVVMDGYLEAMGVRLVAGRGIEARDRANTPPVAVVNEVLARQLWPGRSPASVVGERVRAPFDISSTLREVVGVMGDYRSRRPDAPPAPEVHAPFRQTPIASLSFVARTQGDPVQITGAVRAALARQAPSVALASVRTFGEVVDTSTRTPQLVSRLTALFGLVAAMLAAVGVYGLLSYTTAQRRRELSIRAAVGASRAMLVSLVLREGLALTTIGLVAGAALAWGLSGLLSSLLYGVSATDPSVWLGAAAGLGVCALLGYALPAMRASRVEPANVLRAD